MDYYLAWILQGTSVPLFDILENFLRVITVMSFTQEVVTLLKMTCLEYIVYGTNILILKTV